MADPEIESPGGEPFETPAPRRRSSLLPSLVGLAVALVAAAVYFFVYLKPAPAPAGPPASTVIVTSTATVCSTMQVALSSTPGQYP